MRIYITGIGGFLGSHLADWFFARGDEVWGCDDLTTGTVENLPDDGGFLVRYIGIESLEPEHLEGVDVVFHAAALAYEGVSSFSPTLISKNIYYGSSSVFSAAIAAGVKRIVFTSSMARYGVQPNCYHERMTPVPVDPYGIAKYAAERLLINLCETHGVEWSVGVPHNIFGPRQKYDDPYRNVAAIMANRMLQGEQPIIYGDGQQVRCFSYIDDVVPTLARMGLDPAAKGEIINVGPDEGSVTILKLGRMIAGIIGVPYNPTFLPERPREVKHAVCSSDKARRLLGFEQRTELHEGLEKLVAYIRERGPKPFQHHLPIEIESRLLPATWRK